MNYDHKKLIETITKLDELPTSQAEYATWITAEAHLAFLRRNAGADEVVVYASGEYTFVQSLVVPNANLAALDRHELMNWDFMPDGSIASYVTGGGRDDVWIERSKNATQLIFGRTFEGWSGPGHCYYELHQEYAHLAGIHWRPERRAYCRYDGHGDLEAVVAITTREDKGSSMALASFKWEPLEEYLAASDAALVRKFDFTLRRRGSFSRWSDGPPKEYREGDDLIYHQKIDGNAAYTTGIQIIRPRRPPKEVFTGITDGWFGQKNKQYAEFTAYDWRNRRIAKISTDPKATANYFNSEENLLPFELSPAFFRPEVLLKYKGDRDKYTVGERDVSCRSAWHLEGIDVNDAGQIHAYICYLRRLPYTEQLHWLSFNEEPKESISQRAFINDFQGEFVTFTEPLRKLLTIARRWHNDYVSWWTLRDDKLLERVNTPLTASRDEWAEAFMDLVKLVIEGFEMKGIRAKLDAEHIPYDREDKTIALLEKLLSKNDEVKDARKLNGLRTVQHVRTKAKGHAGGSDADQLAQDALLEHESFANHFRHVCGLVADELERIERSIA